MEKTNNEKFGQFISVLRKEKGLTQKDLAEKCYLSDKAVSKWERGLSMPDISLLIPLSQILGVTVTELLRGERMNNDYSLPIHEVEQLMNQTIRQSAEEKETTQKRNRKIQNLFLLSVSFLGVELLSMKAFGYSWKILMENLFTIELPLLIFGTYFIFFAKTKLPTYYEDNKISFYSHGIFRMNLPAIALNNSNWPKMVEGTGGWITIMIPLFPLLFWGLSDGYPHLWAKGQLIFTLAFGLSLFFPLYYLGKKYQ